MSSKFPKAEVEKKIIKYLLLDTLLKFLVVAGVNSYTTSFKKHLNSNILRSLCKSPLPKQSPLLAVIWTHDRDVRGMGLLSILRHRLLSIPVFNEILHCKAVCDVTSRIDPWLSHHGRGSKLLLVLITLRVLPGR